MRISDWSSDVCSSDLRVVLALVRKAALYPRVQLIFACRSFDLENDHGYREIAATQGNVRVDVGPFARTEIDPVLARLGIFHDADNARLMALLSLPIALRSEADPSELQSPIPNIDAVYRLV